MGDKSPSKSQFVCQYCHRNFKRLEHVQRHERTHTKEAPYQCPCGKAFPRGDLLRRHERSAHNVDTTRRKRSSVYGGSDADTVPSPSVLRRESSVREPVSKSGQLTGSYDLEPNGNPATARHNVETPSGAVFLGNNNSLAIGHSNGDASRYDDFQLSNQAYVMQNMGFGEPFTDPFDLFGDGDAFLENVDFSSLFLPTGLGLSQVMQLGDQAPIGNDPNLLQPQPQRPKAATQNDNNGEQSNSISRFGSPLPSIRSEQKGSTTNNQRQANSDRPVPCWKISASDYSALEKNVEQFMPALPHGFTLPTRHTASRYIHGSIRLMSEHMPLFHSWKFSVATAAPDLVLSMMAVGSQYKFEGSKAVALFYAAKAAINYQIRLKDARVPGMYNGLSQHDANIEFDSLQTMQAILNLMVLGSWGPKQLVGEAIAFQSVLAKLVREEGLGPEDDGDEQIHSGRSTEEAWTVWIHKESLRRTKLFAYLFLSLQSVAYNVSPCILTTEVQINTPAGQDVWGARSADSWALALLKTKIVSTSFSSAYRSLFQAEGTPPIPPSSAVTNHALIFAILQCIFLLREGRATLPYASTTENLRSEDVESLSSALQRWQSRWENSPESTLEPAAGQNPVAFNSTALLRLAWIRLHADLGPCRNLASRDPNLIVESFKSCPPLHRHPGLAFPIIQAAHALSIPVRLGIAYVAKTQTLTWSVQHSLCNLECAIFVSRWFETLAATLGTTPLTAQEIGLIHMFRSIVKETGFFRDEAFEPAGSEKDWIRLIMHLGTAVAVLWAEIFSGSHIFEMVSVIGVSLGIYAKQLEGVHTPINLASGDRE